MTNTIMATVASTLLIVLIVEVITRAIMSGTKKEKKLGTAFLGKLANTDSSISAAINYLRLTNSISDAIEEEKHK